MGKTIQMLSHVFNRLQYDEKETNLIICPAHLVKNWVEEINKHFDFDNKKINVFHGSNKVERENVNIIITSYLLVKKLKCKKYTRIILDEAHYIKNRKTQTFSNVCELEAECKWVMTATPIFNEIDEIKAYLNFLGFDNNISLSRTINKYALLQTKELLNLPEKKEYILEVEMSEVEREYHYEILSSSKKRISHLQQLAKESNDRRMKAFYNMHILNVIMKLRQSCNFVSIEKEINDSGYGSSEEEEKEKEKEKEEEDCFICWSKNTKYISKCGHSICYACWERIISMNGPCPICRSFVSLESLSKKGKQNIKYKTEIVSSKLEVLINLIKERDHKIIVSSQWLSSLNIIEDRLKAENIKCLRIDGSVGDKHHIIDKFKSKDKYKILLVSLNCCAEGLTITEAKTLIHFEFWWNPQKTHQLSSRIHRIGQDSQVSVITLRTKDSIEYMMKEINTIKNNLGKTVMKSVRECQEEENFGGFNTKGIITKIFQFDAGKRVEEKAIES